MLVFLRYITTKKIANIPSQSMFYSRVNDLLGLLIFQDITILQLQLLGHFCMCNEIL